MYPFSPMPAAKSDECRFCSMGHLFRLVLFLYRRFNSNHKIYLLYIIYLLFLSYFLIFHYSFALFDYRNPRFRFQFHMGHIFENYASSPYDAVFLNNSVNFPKMIQDEVFFYNYLSLRILQLFFKSAF